MSALAQQILAVARTEWRVTWRGLGLKLVMLILAVPFIPYLLLPRVNFDDNGMHVFTALAPLFGLLAAFLIVPGPRHERRYRTAELTWVRPLDSLAYVAGKLAAALVVIAVLLAELSVLVAITQASAGFAVGLPIVANALLLVAPALLCVAVLYVVCGALLPHALLGYLLAVAVALLFMFFFSQSIVFLWNPYLVALYYNKALGFGPDGPLLLANRLFYLGVAVTVAGLAIVAFARRERRALAPRRQAIGALAVGLCGVLLAGSGLLRFEQARAEVMISGTVSAPQAVSLSVHGYSLDLRLDPANAGEDGVAQFTIRDDGTAPLTALPLHLNDGLRLGAATVDGHTATVRNSPQFGSITLAPALAPGRSAAVRVAYAGHFKLLHAQYGNNQAGIQTGQMMSGMTPAIFQSYIWNGQAMLYCDGDWFPTPWIQGAMSWQPSPLGWRALTIDLPAGLTAVASSGTTRREGHSQVFTWTLSGRLPRAVLAVPPGSYARVAVPGGTLYAPDGAAAALRARYGPYVTALRDLDRFFGRPASPVAVVAAPLAGSNSGGYPAPVALGGGLVLVPLGGLDVRISGPGYAVSTLAAPAPYRAALSDLAVAWWADRLPSRTMPWLFTSLNPLPPDLPGGYAGLNEQGGYVDSPGALPEYTGAAVAGLRLGAAYYEREMALRRALAAIDRRFGAQGNQKLYQIVYLGKGPLARKLRALGLLGRLDDDAFASDASPALDDLRRAIGAARLRQALNDLSAAGATPNDTPSAACALYHLTGRPVTAWMDRYLNSFAAIKPAGGCR